MRVTVSAVFEPLGANVAVTAVGSLLKGTKSLHAPLVGEASPRGDCKTQTASRRGASLEGPLGATLWMAEMHAEHPRPDGGFSLPGIGWSHQHRAC